MTPTTTIQIATSVDPHEDRDAIIRGLEEVGFDFMDAQVSEPTEGLVTVTIPSVRLPAAMDALIYFVR